MSWLKMRGRGPKSLFSSTDIPPPNKIPSYGHVYLTFLDMSINYDVRSVNIECIDEFII